MSRLKIVDDVIYLNPGSIGRPRDYTRGSFAVISEYAITVFDLSLNVLFEHKI